MSDEITSVVDLDTYTDPIYIIKDGIMYEGYINTWNWQSDNGSLLYVNINVMIRRY